MLKIGWAVARAINTFSSMIFKMIDKDGNIFWFFFTLVIPGVVHLEENPLRPFIIEGSQVLTSWTNRKKIQGCSAVFGSYWYLPACLLLDVHRFVQQIAQPEGRMHHNPWGAEHWTHSSACICWRYRMQCNLMDVRHEALHQKGKETCLAHNISACQDQYGSYIVPNLSDFSIFFNFCWIPLHFYAFSILKLQRYKEYHLSILN